MTVLDFIARPFSHTGAATVDDLPPELAAQVPETIGLVVAPPQCKVSLGRKLSL